MTKFILIRHGDPDYKILNNKNFKGHGNDLAPLTKKGIKKAKEISNNSILKDTNMIICSPYTRTMQTASIISNKLNLPINVELNLHEWLPDLTFEYETATTVRNNYKKAINDYLENITKNNEYESILSVKKRALLVLKKYLKYNKVCVVTHGGVMYSLTNKRYDKFCDYDILTLDKNTINKEILILNKTLNKK